MPKIHLEQHRTTCEHSLDSSWTFLPINNPIYTTCVRCFVSITTGITYGFPKNSCFLGYRTPSRVPRWTVIFITKSLKLPFDRLNHSFLSRENAPRAGRGIADQSNSSNDCAPLYQISPLRLTSNDPIQCFPIGTYRCETQVLALMFLQHGKIPPNHQSPKDLWVQRIEKNRTPTPSSQKFVSEKPAPSLGKVTKQTYPVRRRRTGPTTYESLQQSGVRYMRNIVTQW